MLPTVSLRVVPPRHPLEVLVAIVDKKFHFFQEEHRYYYSSSRENKMGTNGVFIKLK